jgi:hypothetical protein
MAFGRFRRQPEGDLSKVHHPIPLNQVSFRRTNYRQGESAQRTPWNYNRGGVLWPGRSRYSAAANHGEEAQ